MGNRLFAEILLGEGVGGIGAGEGTGVSVGGGGWVLVDVGVKVGVAAGVQATFRSATIGTMLAAAVAESARLIALSHLMFTQGCQPLLLRIDHLRGTG